MSSDVQSSLELLQMNNYLSIATVTAVMYDYVLNFSREVHYVWHRDWTRVTLLFVLVRYFGLFGTIVESLCVFRI
ncbi:hypothetical protein HD554DRAFT_2126533 [Boletus coccyginus]|nr:hypothetical protein HD554DRAFT_2126533 [Boletus coccyginus]